MLENNAINRDVNNQISESDMETDDGYNMDLDLPIINFDNFEGAEEVVSAMEIQRDNIVMVVYYNEREEPYRPIDRFNNGLANIPLREIKEEPLDSSDSDEQSGRAHGFCMVCLTTKSHCKYIILPCGHSWLCQKCRNQNLYNCPYCRNRTKRFVRILETTV